MNSFGTDTEPDQNNDPIEAANYVAFEDVNRHEYAVLHPETAARHLGMVSRTVYKKISQGEMLYTLENGAKRVLVDLDLIDQGTRSDRVPNNSYIRSERSDYIPKGSERRSDDSEYQRAVDAEFTEPSDFTGVLESEQSPNELIEFMRETKADYKSFFDQITGLRVENERYKLLTTGKDKNINDLEAEMQALKNVIYEKDARIAELEEKNTLVVTGHEAKMSEKEKIIFELKGQLNEQKVEIRNLKAETEALRKRKYLGFRLK